MPVRDPWLAVNLSWTLAGLGQFYARRRKSGIVLLAIDLILFLAYIVGMVIASVPFAVAAGLFLLVLPLRVGSLIWGYRQIRAETPVRSDLQNPWLAVFLTRFIPGLGHLYAGRWFRALLVLGVWICVTFLWDPPEHWQPWGWIAESLVVGLLIGDAFLMLRRNNTADRRSTLFGLTVVLAASQVIFIALLLRWTVLEIFKIPSSAMEPTLLGNVDVNHSREYCPFSSYHTGPAGDRIAVSKVAYTFSEIQRYDIVVFRFPLNQSKYFIKRVVGLPNEELKIYKGDLYVRPRGEARFRIARRPLDVQDSLWIVPEGEAKPLESFSSFQDRWSASSSAFQVAGGELSTHESKGDRSVEFTHSHGISDFGDYVGDVRLALEIRLTGSKGQFFAGIANTCGRFEFLIDLEGESQLRHYEKEGAPPLLIVPLKEFRPRADRRYAVELGVLDGMAHARIDGRVIGTIPFIEYREDLKSRETARTHLSFGSRGITFKARDLRIGRDIVYRGRTHHLFGLGEDEAVLIPEGHYLMMGDNVANSHDARAWVKTTFMLKGGRTVVCENQEIKGDLKMELKERLGLPELPDYAVEADQHGNSHAIFEKDLAGEIRKEPFRFIGREFIAGRATKIWWPLQRAGPLR